MELSTVKGICAGVLFIVALIGAALSKFAASFSWKIVKVSNALAGGILLAVTLVHMLADGGEQLESPGVAIAAFFTGDKSAEAFPLGFALTGLGFLASLSVEVFLPGSHEHESHAAHPMEEESDSDAESETESQKDMIVVPASKSCIAGFSALLGLCLHSLIEGTATGAADDMSEFTEMFIAIIAHKMFAVFGAGSLLLHTVSMRAWWTLMIFLSLMTPVGIALGSFLAKSFEGPSAAGLICFAAGSLLCVAVYDMLMPSLVTGKTHWKRRSFLAALLGFCSMSLLAIWS